MVRRRGETDEGLSGREYDRDMMEQAQQAFLKHEIRERGEGRWMLQVRHEDGGWDWTMAAEVVALAGRIYVGGDIYPVVFGWDSGSPRSKVAWLGGTKDVSYYVHQKAVIGMGAGTVVGITDRFDEDVARWDLNQLIKYRLEDRELPGEVDDAIYLLNAVEHWDEDDEAEFPLLPYLEQELGKRWWPLLKAKLGDATTPTEVWPVCKEFQAEMEKAARDHLEKTDPVCEVLRDAIEWGLQDGYGAACRYIYDRMGKVDPDFMSERYDFGLVCDPRVYYAWGALARLHELLLAEEEKERGGEREQPAAGP